MSPQLIALLQAASQGRNGLTLSAFHENQIRWALRTGLGPLLLYTTTSDAAVAHSPLWPLLHGATLTAQFLSDERFDAMCDILDTCEGRVPSVTLLKGISIAEQYYPTPYLRPMTDLDFLVEETVIPFVESLLYKLGYRQQSHRPREFYNTHHHRMPFLHPQRGIWVEVHRGLFPSSTKLATTRVFSHKHLTSQLRPSAFQGRPVTRLSDALQIVYIAAHWAFEFKGIGGMLAMLDLIYLLKYTKEAIDWEAIFDWLDGSIAATHLYLMLTYLARYGLIDIPPQRLHELSLRQRSFGTLNLHIMHKLVDRYMIDRPPSGRLCSAFHLDILWRTLLVPGSPLRNLLRVPWNVLLASRLNPIVKIKSYAAATSSRVTRYPSRSIRRVSRSTRCSRRRSSKE
jgi:Uncharacterised nucleotidyltransferase